MKPVSLVVGGGETTLLVYPGKDSTDFVVKEVGSHFGRGWEVSAADFSTFISNISDMLAVLNTEPQTDTQEGITNG